MKVVLRHQRDRRPAKGLGRARMYGLVPRTQQRIKVVDIELDCGAEPITGLDPYAAIKGLVWLHGTPVGYIDVPTSGSVCTAPAIVHEIVEKLAEQITKHLVGDALAAPPEHERRSASDLLGIAHAEPGEPPTLMTVAVCTRNRSADLPLCLDALVRLEYPHLDLMVVDNAPENDATERIVRDRYPSMRYVRELRPGLDWARNRAISEARGEIVAFTDDDCIVHPGWARAIANAFQEPNVGAVTGLIVPYELETGAQQLFELYGGFGRGFVRKWYNDDSDINSEPTMFLGAGRFGTGASMAFQRAIFDEIGGFDPALDVGTITNGGGDLEMFFRVLKEGYTLVYEPTAVLWHRHRSDYDRLRTQIANNGVGFYSFLVRSAIAYKDERWNVFRVASFWLWWWNIRRLMLSYLSPGALPRDLILAELLGSLVGMRRYPQAQRIAARLAADVETYGPPPVIQTELKPSRVPLVRRAATRVAVRHVEMTEPLLPITGVSNYTAVRVVVSNGGQLRGDVLIVNDHQPITPFRLRTEIAQALGLEAVGTCREEIDNVQTSLTRAVVGARSAHEHPDIAAPIPVSIPVSVVIATYDRPDDLSRCLDALMNQETNRDVEIIVVDNHPSSGVTAAVLARFPSAKLVQERRQGLSYARNAGFAASSGEFILAADDDVTTPPDWLENIIAPFAQPNVMVVTGNTLPAELETDAQRRFEEYGGLGRGYNRKEAGRSWFDRSKIRAVPTWELGATANAAFRAVIFADPEIGLLDEALGTGTPTGCSEDTYLFYKVLKAGYNIVYEPSAYVWHRHRRNSRALWWQIYNYSKGHVAYHLTTVMMDGDLRGLTDIFIRLPVWRTRQLFLTTNRALKGWHRYPVSLIVAETAGNIAGPFALWRSRRRVRCLGRSAPYIPVNERQDAQTKAFFKPDGPLVYRGSGDIYEPIMVEPIRLESAPTQTSKGEL